MPWPENLYYPRSANRWCESINIPDKSRSPEQILWKELQHLCCLPNCWWHNNNFLNSTSKSANHFSCQGNGCQHIPKLYMWWLMVYLWKKSSPINILGSWYPPTCHGATMFLIPAPGPRNGWAFSTASFTVMLISILTHWECYTPPHWNPCWNIVPVWDPHLVKDIEAIEPMQRFATTPGKGHWSYSAHAKVRYKSVYELGLAMCWL